MLFTDPTQRSKSAKLGSTRRNLSSEATFSTAEQQQCSTGCEHRHNRCWCSDTKSVQGLWI